MLSRKKRGYAIDRSGVAVRSKKCRECDRFLTHDHFWPIPGQGSRGYKVSGFCRRCRPSGGCNNLPLGEPGTLARARLKTYSPSTVGITLHLACLAQGSLECACCLYRPATCVDHDHATGAVRGAVCGHCNSRIGVIEKYDRLGLDAPYRPWSIEVRLFLSAPPLSGWASVCHPS